MNCKDAVAGLIASLETGSLMSDEARAHVAECERCAVLLDSARDFQTSLHEEIPTEAPVEPAASLAEREVLRTKRQRIAVRIVGVIIVGAMLAFLASVAQGAGTQTERLQVFFGGLAIAILIAIPFFLIFAVARAIVRPRKGQPLYKRLGPGRMISGVALGLSEVSRINVGIVRLLFFGLFFFEGVGLLLYILLAIFMPVHPDDRQYILRFRLRRWLRREPGSADSLT